MRAVTPAISTLSLGALLIGCSMNREAAGPVQAVMRTLFAASAVSGDFRMWRPGSKPAARVLTFRLPGAGSGGGIQLDRGFVVADSDDWCSLAVSETDLGNGYIGRCTATLVGPVTMLTAAHCVDTGQGTATLPGTVTFGEETFESSCEMHPRYAAAELGAEGGVRNRYDYALCELTHASDDPRRTVDLTVVAPDNVDTASDVASRRILLTGYGCTDIVIDWNGEFTFRSADGVELWARSLSHAPEI